MLFSAFPLVTNSYQEVTTSYDLYGGLSVQVGGVPWIRGSAFQYTDAATGRSIYASRWSPKTVGTLPDGKIRIVYSGANGDAIGNIEISRKLDGFESRFQFKWKGNRPVAIETTLGLLWSPAVMHGEILADGEPIYALLSPRIGDWTSRRMSQPASHFDFNGGFASAQLTIRGGKAELFDARRYTADWAKGTSTYWLGIPKVVIQTGETAEFTTVWNFSGYSASPKSPQLLEFKTSNLPVVVTAPRMAPVIVPKPKSFKAHPGSLLLTKPNSNSSEIESEFSKRVSGIWKAESTYSPITTKLNPSFKKDEYHIFVHPARIKIEAHSKSGIGYALEYLISQISLSQQGLSIGCQEVSDWPDIQYRGVHTITGQNGVQFAKRLVSDFWSRLRINELVVQCERTQWDSVTNLVSTAWPKKSELLDFFEHCRTNGIEPTPLIQSLGHMDWLLDSKYRNFAVNPDIPYTLDSRKKDARNLMVSIWDEALSTLRPKAAHFGFDEIGMRGFPDDQTLATRLCSLMVPDLAAVARKHKIQPCFWGDMGLAPNEAVDATHAISKFQAQQVRQLFPKGARIFDWHYAPLNQPEKYTSLELWKSQGLTPVATSWFRSKNIQGHTLAAQKQGAGTLQTTWAGYETSEKQVVSNSEQFQAQIVASNLSWNTQTSMESLTEGKLRSYLAMLLWPDPIPLSDQGGLALIPDGHPIEILKIGRYAFATIPVIQFFSKLSGPNSLAPSQVSLNVHKMASGVVFAVQCDTWMNEGTPIARIRVVGIDGQEAEADILYGRDLRSPEDLEPPIARDVNHGWAAFPVHLPSNFQVERIEIRALESLAGLRIKGVSLW